MKVFISWSGEQSRRIAEALRDWLPLVIQAIDPYMSAQDNQAGTRWSDEVSAQLEATDFGILCLTPDNLGAPWLHFEAGALGKAIERSRVVPLLYGLTPANVESPLSQFMMKTADRAGIKAIVSTINSSLDRPMSEVALDRVFGALWPQLQERLHAIEAERVPPEDVAPQREDRELLEEVLQILRSLRIADSSGTAEGVAHTTGHAVGRAGASLSGTGTLSAFVPIRESPVVVKALGAVMGSPYFVGVDESDGAILLHVRAQHDARQLSRSFPMALKTLESNGYKVEFVNLDSTHPLGESPDSPDEST